MDAAQIITTEPRPPRRSSDTDTTLIWQPNDPVDEVSWLLAEDSEETEEERLAGQFAALTSEDIATNQRDLEEEPTWIEQAVEVHFEGRWYGLFAPEETINVVYSGADGEQVEERSIRSLRPRDQVLFIHGQRRQSLYDLVISRIHRHPAIELHLALIRRWQEDFSKSYRQWQRRGLRNVNELLSEMQARGCQRGSASTLRQWLQGKTLCPQDAEDLRRVADILNMDFVRQYYQRIYRAASRLNGLHRGLGNRINRWLREQAAGIDVGNVGEIFDEELGLSLQDFLDSILILRVISSSTKSGPFLRTSLGLRKEGENSE